MEAVTVLDRKSLDFNLTNIFYWTGESLIALEKLLFALFSVVAVSAF